MKNQSRYRISIEEIKRVELGDPEPTNIYIEMNVSSNGMLRICQTMLEEI